MKLPQLVTPTFELTIPSTGKKIEYRPYLVKEEKILMMAMESGQDKENILAMKKIIHACTFGKIKLDDLTVCDVEYIFLKLRSKSVGETVSVQVKCEKCSFNVPIDVNLSNIEVSKNFMPIESKIQLTPNVGVIMRPITFKMMEEIENSTDPSMSTLAANKEDKITLTLKLIALSIESIYDESKIYPTSDVSKEELNEFIGTLNRAQIEKIQHYVESLPKLSHNITVICPKCSDKKEHTLQGLKAFFV